MKSAMIFLCFGLLPLVGVAVERTPAPQDARLYFIAPQNGEHVPNTFTVRFGLKGMGVAPAGINLPRTGHHHLLINVDPMPDFASPLPASNQIRHFGKGQTEADIKLESGVYHLKLILGNHLHIPHAPPVMSKTITITVE